VSSTTSPPPAEIFKAYDIRGIVGTSLTPEHVRNIGRAIGSEALARGRSTIILGRDGRLSGPSLTTALGDGILGTGCDIVDIGQAPTPVLYFATHELDTGSGVAITGSHNPPEYNGFKIMLAGDTLSGDAIQDLRRRIERNDLVEGQGSRREARVIDAYVERIVSTTRPTRGLRVVLDCGNGVAGAVAPRLFRELGCDVVELYCEVDGNFPNHHPDPSQPENLRELIATVKRTGADVGLAFDGDGDRLGVVSPDGDVIWPDRQLILFARAVLADNPGAEVIYDVKCTRNLPLAIEAAGGRPLLWKTGHSFIKAKLRETGAPLAGEMSGHIFFNDRWYGFDDGLYAGARLLELLAADRRSPREVFADLPDSLNTPELRLEMTEGEHHALIRELVEAASFPDARVSTIDGLRVEFDDGFGLLRGSNTTPTVIFRFEGDDTAALERIQARFRDLIDSVRPGLAIPF